MKSLAARQAYKALGETMYVISSKMITVFLQSFDYQILICRLIWWLLKVCTSLLKRKELWSAWIHAMDDNVSTFS